MEKRNQRNLLLALLVLLVGLAIAIAKNHAFWFGSDEPAEVENTAPVSNPHTVAPVAPAPTLNNPVSRNHSVPTPKSRVVTKNSTSTGVEDSNVVADKPAELPPMEVEVVAGDSHRTLRPGSNSVLVVMPPAAGFRTASATAFKWIPLTNAAEKSRISGDQPEYLVEGTYPALDRDMKVKGSVLLQASVGADGGIRNLRVLSGNPILTSAAKEAARQWRFRPSLQNGQAVPAQQQITVNFTIKVL